MPVNNKSDLSSSLESLRLFNTLILFVLLFALSGCDGSGYGEGTLDQEAKDYHKPVSVSAGLNTSCITLKSGVVKCWGWGLYWQLGNLTANPTQLTPLKVENISNAIKTEVSNGYYWNPGWSGGKHTCAVLSDGTVKCWGDNGSGRLGNGSTSNSSTPVTVSNISTATSVSLGSSHTCALLSDGTVKCWGDNGSGRLGNGSTSNSSTPVTVSNISTATSVSLGSSHTCALLSDGTVKCWGEGSTGQLGDGASSDNSSPTTVSGISTATSVSAGFGHTCAVLSDGTVKCWGEGSTGQLGDGASSDNSSPTTVSGISTATLVSTGEKHTCTLLSDGTVKCWGSYLSGRLGCGIIYEDLNFVGNTTQINTPVTVKIINTAISVSAGGQHTCALLSDGTVKCWGYGLYGQLGNGHTMDIFSPVTVVGLDD